MAHLITSTDGAVYVGARPWHSRGETLADAEPIPAGDAARRSNTYWSPVLSPLRVIGIGALDGLDADIPMESERVTDLDGMDVPGGSVAGAAVRRSDTGAVLGLVGHKYQPLGPAALADLLDAAGLPVVSWVTLRGGRDVVATLKGSPLSVVTSAGRDDLEQFTLLHDTTDGSARFTVRGSVRRVDCANMLRMAQADAQAAVAARHTAASMAKAVSAVRSAVEAQRGKAAQEARFLQALAQYQLDAASRRRYWVSLWESLSGQKAVVAPATDAERKRALAVEGFVADLQAALDADDAQRSDRGSLYGAVQAVSRWATHDRTVRRGAQGLTEADARQTAILVGTSGTSTAKALALAGALL